MRRPGDDDVEPGTHRRVEERRGLLRQAAETHQVVQPGGSYDELADVEGQSICDLGKRSATGL